MPISSLPVPPTRQDPTNFADRADSFLAALPTFAIEANALQTDVNSKQASAAVSATNAQAAATAAQASAGVTLWNAGTTYTQGQTVYSPTSFYTYRRKVAGQTATDPASDATNWVQVTGTGNVSAESTVVNFTGATGVNSGGQLGLNNNQYVKGKNTGGTYVALLGVGSDNAVYLGSVSSFSPVYAYGTTYFLQDSSGVYGALNRSSSYTLGNFGIGTSAPSAQLSIRGTSTSQPHLQLNTNSTGLSETVLGLGSYADDNSLNSAGCSIKAHHNHSASPATAISFWTSPSGSSTQLERLRIDALGYVGIGVTSPTSVLDANGNTFRLRGNRTISTVNALGNQGDICWDSNYIYVCVATNTWKRTALSAW